MYINISNINIIQLYIYILLQIFIKKYILTTLPLTISITYSYSPFSKFP